MGLPVAAGVPSGAHSGSVGTCPSASGGRVGWVWGGGGGGGAVVGGGVVVAGCLVGDPAGRHDFFCRVDMRGG